VLLVYTHFNNTQKYNIAPIEILQTNNTTKKYEDSIDDDIIFDIVMLFERLEIDDTFVSVLLFLAVERNDVDVSVALIVGKS
jgi:hypothetical protein